MRTIERKAGLKVIELLSTDYRHLENNQQSEGETEQTIPQRIGRTHGRASASFQPSAQSQTAHKTPTASGSIDSSECSASPTGRYRRPVNTLLTSSLSDLSVLEARCIVASFTVTPEGPLVGVIFTVTPIAIRRHLDSRSHRSLMARMAMKMLMSAIQQKIRLHVVLELP